MVGNLAIATLKPNEYRYLHIKPCLKVEGSTLLQLKLKH